jgi:SNW domain-containing protein 1
VALGLAKPTASKETMIDSRLFNRETLSGSFGGDDSYNMYDKPLFHGSAAAAAIYKPLSSTAQAAGDETYGGGTEDGVVKNLQNDRFALGVSHAFEGTDGPAAAGERSGPVQFEKDTVATVDPFGLDEFLDQAKAGKKRGGLELSEKSVPVCSSYPLFSQEHALTDGGFASCPRPRAKGKRAKTDGED